MKWRVVHSNIPGCAHFRLAHAGVLYALRLLNVNNLCGMRYYEEWISMNISSNTLFHFTDKIENVIGILKEGFRPHFCLEDLNFILPDEPTEDLEWAIPMVCFCDVPLSQSKTHRKTYGNYGIGLSKEWGKNNKISPVFYSHQNSAIIDTIRQMWINAVRDLEKSGGQQDVDDHGKGFDDVYGVYCFTKSDEGRRWINKGKRYSEETVSFYDEREWRFVPMHEDRFEYGLPKKQFLDGTEQSYVNQELGKLSGLHFELSDIKYIIVSNDDEIVRIITEIEKNMGGHSQDDIKLLSSRVISAKHIDEDF